MPDLQQLSDNLNAVLDGSQKVGVDARISNEDLMKMAGVIFLSFFLAVLLANAITK